MKISRTQFFQLVAGGSAWLVSSGFARRFRSGQAQKIKLAVEDTARPLPLAAVRLTGGPLKKAQDLDAAYLLSLDPDRMLAFYRKRAGLPQQADGYTGWDADGRQLTGHIAGHHLSAVSLMFAATGDARFKQRADYLVAGIKECQDANGDGFAGALSGVKEAFAEVSKGNIKAANFDLNGLWSPWYTLHKTFAGLRDAYRHTGSQTALDVSVKFGAWAERYLAPMEDAAIQRMLACEFGGMNEMMADLYADTGDRRWLDLSYKFEHQAVLDPLKRGEDPLSSLHGNTQVPKLIGSASRYAYAGNKEDLTAAAVFWDRVVNHHTFATGGHGKDEYFREPDKLGNITEGRTAETCNVYNMLKLTRKLFALQPDVRYADFHERALFNHILGSMDGEDGATCYMVPVGSGVRREYADMHRSFTCCVGTGMESHALHGLGVYYESGTGSREPGAGSREPGVPGLKLWVNLYAPSIAQWESAGVKLTMATSLPEGDSAYLTLDLRQAKSFTLALRRPSWVADGFEVRVNDRRVAQQLRAGYVEITRTWQPGDEISIMLPKSLRIDRLADRPSKAVVMWGPLVLAGDLGAAPRRRDDGDGDGVRAAAPEPVALVTARPVAEWLKPVDGRPGVFRAQGVARAIATQSPIDIEFSPFYSMHRRTYAAYWDLLTPAELAARARDLAAERERTRALEAATIVSVPIGDREGEKQFNQQGVETSVIRSDGRSGRRAIQWFSYDLPLNGQTIVTLVATYNSDQRRPRSFDVIVDGQKVGAETQPQSSVSHFYEKEYGIAPELIRHKEKLTVRFEATNGLEVTPVFGVRLITR
ncbi:MAG TPA: beta-L-arabinofuranosidase domain-containing protein [Vicinamibacterales bacterium]